MGLSLSRESTPGHCKTLTAVLRETRPLPPKQSWVKYVFDGFRFFAFVSEVHGHPALNFVLGERGQTPLHEFCFGGKGEETLAWATVSLRMLCHQLCFGGRGQEPLHGLLCHCVCSFPFIKRSRKAVMQKSRATPLQVKSRPTVRPRGPRALQWPQSPGGRGALYGHRPYARTCINSQRRPRWHPETIVFF